MTRSKDCLPEALGPLYHHTIRRLDTQGNDGKGMTFGGLYRNKDDAEQALKQASNNEIGIYGLDPKKIKSAQVVYLEEGEQFSPWAMGGAIYIHGVDDGTHGSPSITNNLSAWGQVLAEH